MSTPPSGSPFASPSVGSTWGGGGMTCRVVDVWPDGVTVRPLTKVRGGRLKRPGGRVFIPLTAFVDGRMKPVEWRGA